MEPPCAILAFSKYLINREWTNELMDRWGKTVKIIIMLLLLYLYLPIQTQVAPVYKNGLTVDRTAVFSGHEAHVPTFHPRSQHRACNCGQSEAGSPPEPEQSLWSRPVACSCPCCMPPTQRCHASAGRGSFGFGEQSGHDSGRPASYRTSLLVQPEMPSADLLEC